MLRAAAFGFSRGFTANAAAFLRYAAAFLSMPRRFSSAGFISAAAQKKSQGSAPGPERGAVSLAFSAIYSLRRSM